MAKVGFWLKGAKGKLGSSSISTQNGTTVIRTINENPTNPRTSKQMYQRAIFATVAKAAAAMKFIIDHSFENVKDGEDCVRKFRKLNLNALRNQVADDIAIGTSAAEVGAKLAPKGYPYITPNAYIVSAGSLTSPKVKLVCGDDDIKRAAIAVPVVGTVTCKKFLQEVFGLQPGDQLTLCVIYAGTGAQFISVGSGGPGEVCFENEFAAKRIVFLPYAGNENEWDADCVDDGEIATPAFENVIDEEKTDMGFFSSLFGEITATVNQGVTTISSAATLIDAANCKAGALIRSKMANGKWQYSNATMVVAAPTVDNFGLAPADAVDTYASSVSVGNDSDPFLDEGGSGGSNSDF